MEQAEGVLAAAGCGRVVAGQPLHGGEPGENLRLLDAVTEVTAERQGLLQRGGGGALHPRYAARQAHECASAAVARLQRRMD